MTIDIKTVHDVMHLIANIAELVYSILLFLCAMGEEDGFKKFVLISLGILVLK